MSATSPSLRRDHVGLIVVSSMFSCRSHSVTSGAKAPLLLAALPARLKAAPLQSASLQTSLANLLLQRFCSLQLQIAVFIHHKFDLAIAIALKCGALESNRKTFRFQFGETQPLTPPSTVNRQPILTTHITRPQNEMSAVVSTGDFVTIRYNVVWGVFCNFVQLNQCM